ncbi:hypothetical protein DSI35_00765 [Mycobacterium tuberculosis]|uniref:Uncharacterized protein Rv1519 n=16 Tax=Mycobacterium tuberculosis complex TaxID=77643 RepID=Y1519_MYCTU|nr:DegT/DnrJ/EryC1/StrS family aminotransferase [Mycobacterium tuberculosis]NP_216035.1 hypothetical protein Rv1519 [Mycobacterium tuberculosis H37Rv]P64862.1 RecName: Full=Uncharacterized protein Mb1546 [Mycobacterium tuberculosis variant bovis AF2122/97]P9WLV6.1 RecName: Full=Uncharacterized protein MT1569 [Mycobacterium tuberculosis CDC1551]P9WLV7.1 RecName: Full=Uncharacterized protein Rv1519 [Mycobacterium tuberculosis H37Rv]ABQ73276.1 hypothetical protein MRA_1531 [Mycobacterium tubercul
MRCGCLACDGVLCANGPGRPRRPALTCTAVATRTLHSLATNAELVESADLTVTEDICSRIVSLPVHDHMAIADVARVVAPFGEGLARGG